MRRSSIDNPLYTREGSDFTLGLTFTPPYSWFTDKNYASPNIKDKDKYRWIEFHKWKFQGKVFMPLDKNKKFVLYTGVQYGYLGHFDKTSVRRSKDSKWGVTVCRDIAFTDVNISV